MHSFINIKEEFYFEEVTFCTYRMQIAFFFGNSRK